MPFRVQRRRRAQRQDGGHGHTVAAPGHGPLRSAAKQLAAYCRERGIEVIHAQYPRENIVALLSLKHYSAPRVVYTNHLTIRSGLRWRILNRMFTPKDHRIIAVCRDIMIQNGVCPERIEVIYNGVEPWADRSRDLSARKSLGVGGNDFMLTIFARYAPEKGLDFLLDSLAQLRRLTATDDIVIRR